MRVETQQEDKLHRHSLRPIEDNARSWVLRTLTESWGSPQIVTRGVIHQADKLPGFIVYLGEQPVGLVTYHISGHECEIVSLDSLKQGRGIGSALIEAVREAAIRHGCHRLWLITTNDNMPALRFYQKRGFHLVALYPGALEYSRRLKPQISLVGLEDIPLRDEIELELSL